MVSDARLWPEFNGSSAPEKVVVEVESSEVMCDGDGDHPRVYYTIPEGSSVTCGYCDLVYVKKNSVREKK